MKLLYLLLSLLLVKVSHSAVPSLVNGTLKTDNEDAEMIATNRYLVQFKDGSVLGNDAADVRTVPRFIIWTL